MKLEIEVSKVSVVRTSGTDKVIIWFDAPTPFPEMGYPASMTIDCRQGYAENWLSQMGITEFDIVGDRPR